MSHFQVWMFSKLRISLGLTSKRGTLKMFVYFSSWKTDIMVNYFYKSFQIFRNFIPLGNKVKILKLFKCWWNGIVCLWSALVTLTCQMFAVSGSWGGFVGLSQQAGGGYALAPEQKSCGSTEFSCQTMAFPWKRAHMWLFGWLMGLKESKAKRAL